MVKLSDRLVKYRSGEKESEKFIDERLLNTPSMAVKEAENKLHEMMDMAFENFRIAVTLSDKWDNKVYEKLLAVERKIDYYEDRLNEINVKIAARPLSQEDSEKVSMMLHTVTDIERIGDRAVNIAENIESLIDKGIRFSENARTELNVIVSAVGEIIQHTRNCFIEGDIQEAYMIESLEEVVDDLVERAGQNHVRRLKNGTCSLELGLILNEILLNVERISDHCSNLAAKKLEEVDDDIRMHEYKRQVKHDEKGSFADLYREFSLKYSL